MSTAFSNYQASLGLTFFFPLQGVYPAPTDGSDSAAALPLGTIRITAANFVPGPAADPSGQLLSINDNGALFQLIGTTYGGDGRINFALPDLEGRVLIDDGQGTGLANYLLGEKDGAASVILGGPQLPASVGGGGQAFESTQPSLALKYLIAINSTFPTVGTVIPFAGNFVPQGFVEATGQLLDIDGNEFLFSRIGTTYGGDGATTFRLPDLRGRTIVGVSGDLEFGQTLGQEATTLTDAQLPVSVGGGGEPVDNRQPTIALNYILATQGTFPSQGGQVSGSQPYVGEMFAYLGPGAPPGYVLADGQALEIADYQLLFTVLGTTYGGDGQTTFNLPDLRDRAAVDTASSGNEGPDVGELFGANTFTLTGDQVSNDAPDLTGVGPSASVTEQVAGDLDTDIQVSDLELDALNANIGNYAGAFFTVARQGGARDQDAFAFSTAGATFAVAGTATAGTLTSGGSAFASYTGVGGLLRVDFTSSASVATATLVDEVLSHVTYNNISDLPPANVQLSYTFNDGGVGVQQGIGGALTDTGDITVTITPVIDPGEGEDGGGGGSPAPAAGADIFGTPNPDDLPGTDFGERIFGLSLDDTIRGFGGNDRIAGNTGDDTIWGGQGADTIWGGQGQDYLLGNLGDDLMFGNLGDDTLRGGQGNDLLNGGQGADLLYGDRGDDTLNGGLDADRLVFGAASGADLVLGLDAAAGDRLDLQGQTYTLSASPDGSAIITLSGGGTVTLTGVSAANVNPSFFA